MSAAGGGGPVVLVVAVGEAEGARGVAAALACAGADVDRATLLVDVGGRAPRPTLLASAAARRLEERLAAHLPSARVAARGQVCHLSLSADAEGLEAAAAASTVAREGAVVVQAPPTLLQTLLDGPGPAVTGVLLRADLAADRALVALLVRDLLDRDLVVAVAKHRLGWVAERRALFGALSPISATGLPTAPIRRLLSHECYIIPNGPATDPTRNAKPEWGDHAGAGPR
jgi:hypothetical protein